MDVWRPTKGFREIFILLVIGSFSNVVFAMYYISSGSFKDYWWLAVTKRCLMRWTVATVLQTLERSR